MAGKGFATLCCSDSLLLNLAGEPDGAIKIDPIVPAQSIAHEADKLRPEETQVLRLIAHGNSSRQVALLLGISLLDSQVSSVQCHVEARTSQRFERCALCDSSRPRRALVPTRLTGDF